MPRSLTNLLTHVIFSTKDRQPSIRPEIKTRLFAYVGGIVRKIGGKALIVGGASDHVHILLELPPTVALADAMRLVKTNSSRWLNENNGSRFAWQMGYGAFTVSRSNVPAVSRYIAEQEKHHTKMDFKQDYIQFLKKHGVKYDDRYIWN